MERQIAIAYLNLTRVFNALQISSLGLEDLQTLNLEAWKLAAHCDRFPEWFDSYMDPSFLVSDCLEHVLHSSRGLFVGTLEDRWQQIETIDGLLDFLEQLKLLLASEGTMEEGNDRVVHLEGPIGQFLRRIVIALESLSFEDLCLLLDYWHSLDASVSKKEFPMPTSSALDFQVPSSLLPQVDHESHLLLESMSYGVISSYEDMEKILNITTNDSSTTKTELVRFLQSIENADLDSAVSSLHRYFDMELCSLNCGPQQASLLLAAAYFTLGVQSLAVMNLHETIKVSQQAGDKHCQLQALLWLCLVDKHKKHLLIERVNQLTEEPNYKVEASLKLEEWRISGNGMLSSMALNASHNEEEQEHIYFKDYLENFHLNSGFVNVSRVASCILEAKMWRLKGFLDISHDILEECHSREANNSFSYSSLQCICALSLLDLELGNFQDAIGRFDIAIQHLSSERNYKAQRTFEKDLIRIHVLNVLFWRSVYRQEIHLAQHILEKLENVFPCIEYSTCFDNTLLIHQAKCAMAQLEGDYERALRICNEWEKLSISKEKPLDYLEAKICEANIFLHTSAPVKALLPALQVAKISEMNNIEYYRLVSCLIVVEVQCQMHQFEAAQNNLERIEPLLRNSVPPLYQGKAYLLRAHIKATCCTQSPIRPGDILQKSNILSSALNDVQLALGCFQKMELCFYIRECHFFKAMIQEAIHSNDECLSTRVAPSDWFPHRKETKQQIACYEVLEKLNKL